MQIYQQHYRLDRKYRANVRDERDRLLYQSPLCDTWSEAKRDAQKWMRENSRIKPRTRTNSLFKAE